MDEENYQVIRTGEAEVWRELAFWDNIPRFNEIKSLLRERYGARINSNFLRILNEACKLVLVGAASLRILLTEKPAGLGIEGWHAATTLRVYESKEIPATVGASMVVPSFVSTEPPTKREVVRWSRRDSGLSSPKFVDCVGVSPRRLKRFLAASPSKVSETKLEP
jgi:hypothetical protein